MRNLYRKFKDSAGVCIDTRKLREGEMFFALKGPNFNANEFALPALKNHASYAVVDDPALKNTHPGIILVDDVLKSMQQLALYHRRQFKGHLLALTGSNGKTTTKELLHAVLKNKFNTHATVGNYNNLIGLPFTILNCPEECEFLILEMGANTTGEIKQLCEIAEPNYGMITNIGKAHIEGFKSIEGVKKAKGELYDFLAKSQGIAFVNLNEPFLQNLSKSIEKRIFYSTLESGDSEDVITRTRLIKKHPFLSVEYQNKHEKWIPVQSKLPGAYNYHNIAAAIVVGKYFDLSDGEIQNGIEGYSPVNNRSQWMKKDDNQFFMDAYNANPSSLRASVFDFLENCPNPKILILGDMLELGESSLKEHRQIVDELLSQKDNYEQLWLVGSEFGKLRPEKDVLFFETSTEAKVHLQNLKLKNHYLFIKGSRGILLEKIIA
nr:UDP-N-acetylmuramoyl-tripeptide--D-alanyl-D-alanine ligase [Saprospiraceae bacterium]